MTATTSLVDRADFPAAGRTTYLNSASVALMTADAEAAVADWYGDLAQNGTLHFDEAAEERVFEDLRRGLSTMIGAAPRDIAVASSATELIASIAWALMPKSGTTILTTDVVFPSTAYPWSRVARHTGATVRFLESRNGVIDEDELVEAINRTTSVVSICHVEYATGQRYDLARVAEAARKVGAFVLIDASQSLGAAPLSVAEAPVDAVVTTSYKWLCGPFGVGILYLAPQWQDRLDPGIVGWRTNADIYDLRADRCVMSDEARRFEFGTTAYGSAVGLSRSVAFLQRIGIDRVFEYTVALTERLAEGLIRLGAEVVSPRKTSVRSAITSARFPGHRPADIVAHLAKEGIVASVRRDVVRFSPHVYNTADDIDRALEVLAFAAGG